MKFRSFKLKLILSYAFVILVSFGLIGFFLDKSLEGNSLRNIQSSLITQAKLIEGQITGLSLIEEDTPLLEALIKKLSLNTDSRITLINAKGKVLADSQKALEDIPLMENHIHRPEVKTALNGTIGSDIRYSPTLRIDMLYVALPFKDKNSTIGVLRLALTLESVQKALWKVRKIVMLGVLFSLGLAFILGSMVASRVIDPINRMIQVSRKFSKGDFTRRIILAPRDEIGELAVTLNKMAGELEHKIAEINAQNQKLAAIFNSMIEGVIIVDNETRIVSINQTVENIFTVSKNEAQGKIFLEAIRNGDISEVINDVLKSGKALSGEIKLVLPVRRTFQFNAVPIFNNNRAAGCLVVIHDITEIRKLETMRSDFVANVSHELKTPLTSIKGFVETLLDGALDDKDNNRNFLKIIQDHTERLNKLVDDLLSLSYLESKGLILEKKTFDLKHQVEEVILGFKSQLGKKNIKINNEVGTIKVNADKDRIAQVFTNLFDNAIKFNKDKGEIRIFAEENDNGIKIFIEDSGPGIPEKDIPRIFERFYRVDKARSRELGGTGLGLSIVKHIVELHGGIVGVESTEGLGSKFFFTLPK